MRRGRIISGFTLVELLISLVLFAIVLSAAVAINIGTSRSAASLQARNDLLPETQIAQNYMVSKVQQAAYLFPAGSTITMSSSATTQNLSGSSAWTVGTDPIVAFFLPPKQDSATTLCTTATPDYCYTFYAYYPLRRSVLVTNTSGAANPGANPASDSSEWVLMEYRAIYTAAPGYPAAATSLDSTLQGGVGHIVMDYLRPPASGETLFSQSDVTTVVGQTSVSINLAAQRVVTGQTLSIPANGRFSVTVYPRNVGKFQVGTTSSTP